MSSALGRCGQVVVDPVHDKALHVLSHILLPGLLGTDLPYLIPHLRISTPSYFHTSTGLQLAELTSLEGPGQV